MSTVQTTKNTKTENEKNVRQEKASPTTSEVGTWGKVTSEEYFFACLTYYLLSFKKQDRARGLYYLEEIPDEVLTDPKLKKMYQILQKVYTPELVNRKWEEIVVVLSEGFKAQGLSIADLLQYHSFVETSKLIPDIIFREIAMTLIEEWRKRRIEEYRRYVLKNACDSETLLQIAEKIREIENFDPFFKDEDDDDFFLARCIKPEDFNGGTEWLYEGFLAAGTINIWYAPPAQGKSALALAVSLHLLREGKVEQVFYFDGDNPKMVIEQRGIPSLVEKYPKRFLYFCPKDSYEFKMLLKEFKKRKRKGKVLVVVDTLQRLMGGSLDINKAQDALRVMEFLRQLVRHDEELSVTLIVLHHVNKMSLDGNGRGYNLIDRLKGSTVFADNCDVAYFFTKRNQEDGSLFVCLQTAKTEFSSDLRSILRLRWKGNGRLEK